MKKRSRDQLETICFGHSMDQSKVASSDHGRGCRLLCRSGPSSLAMIRPFAPKCLHVQTPGGINNRGESCQTLKKSIVTKSWIRQLYRYFVLDPQGDLPIQFARLKSTSPGRPQRRFDLAGSFLSSASASATRKGECNAPVDGLVPYFFNNPFLRPSPVCSINFVSSS
mmetsp:Transcript_29223/g.80280  ORF Transcript_29223/g.80280 Transcript_29223/m.80280 type:complete len:168 (-) Transcript_29223:485-988(-)